MEAEKTVMGEEEMLCCSLIGKFPFEDVRDVIEETCIHQAEITFPLGKQEGIREVVEWIQYHLPDYEFGDKWQAKLKDWGL